MEPGSALTLAVFGSLKIAYTNNTTKPKPRFILPFLIPPFPIMRSSLVAAAVLLPLVSACADHAQHVKRMQYARQAPSASSSPHAASSAPPVPPAGSSPASTPAAPPASAPGQPSQPAPSGAAPGQTTPPSGSVPPTTSISVSLLATNPTAVPLSSIAATAVSATTRPLDNTPAAGSQPTFIPGAPGLPNGQ